ncbi:MAG: endonuclease MutS2 [Armatimonadota bacterium]|nr:endonuclease MutS2 [Armatimonadota bacterium]
MNERSLRVLEFHKIIDTLKDQAASELGRQAAARTSPSSDLELVKLRQRETSEATAILQGEGRIPLSGIRDIRPLVEKAGIESMLQQLELLDIAETLAAGRRLRAFLVKLQERYPLIVALGRKIVVFERIEEEIARCIAGNGEVQDSASAALASARSGIKSTHARLMDRLHNILQSAQHRTAIQDPIITLREDRYCIPVKSEFRSQIPGIVHDSSASGATIFVEPATVVEIGNDLKRLTIKEREEIEKVLLKLTALITAAADGIFATLDALAEIDFITARARLGLAQSAVEPELNDSGRIEMREARHPLLTGNVVPIDVEMGRRFRALLITGPNTGGKTVTLKTIGLLTLMAQSGLHVPAAAGARLAVFDEVFADIGDEQSIEQSLSTFSSHVGNIVRALADLTPNSLVLLDEIGAGTDPAEGAALAKALLDYLVEIGARTVATTHYGELKEFAFIREEVENACVEFDPETLRPTYHLIVGVPGSSNAFAIASRLGMPQQIIHKAEEELFGDHNQSASIIRDIEQARRSTLDEERKARKSRVDAESLRRRYEEMVRKAEAARVKAHESVKVEAENLIRKYTKRLDRALEDLSKQKAESGRAQKLEKEMDKTLEEMTEQLVEIPEIEEEPEGRYSFRTGDTVRIASLHQEGILLTDPREGEATVQVGVMKVTVPVSALRPPRKTSPQTEQKQEPLVSADSGVTQAQSISPELKLIAQRVEPALENLDRYMGEAIAAGLAEVRVIHGMGTGALKRAVWEYLKDNPAVESYRLAERNRGGAGATIVELKK